MVSPIEQLEKILYMLESDKSSYEKSLQETAKAVDRYAEVIHNHSIDIAAYKEAISRLKAADTIVCMDITEVVKQDILLKGKIYQAFKNAVREF